MRAMRGAGYTDGAALLIRLKLGRRAIRRQRWQIKPIAERRAQQRQTTSANYTGADVFVANSMVRMQTDLLGAGGHANQRQARHVTPELLMLWVATEISLVRFFTQ